MAPRILICAQDEGSCNSFKLVLGDYYELISLGAIDRCIDIIKCTPTIELVFFDIKLQNQKEVSIIQGIKDQFPKVKLIVIAGHKFIDTAEEAVRLGASGFIVKPLKADEILAVVRNTIGSVQT